MSLNANYQSFEEAEAIKRLQAAFDVLHLANQRCEEAGYGSQIRGPVDEALTHIAYAL